ncbi:MAG: hypothetical protein DME18_12880 [Verrucomicrobia bacterium]|nr:MAG: hypothetical protein DME18_12880 [Verrucomicrobiota bacterium]
MSWSRGRLWAAFMVALLAQLGLIFWLSERKSIVPRRSDSTTTFYLLADAPPGSPVTELLEIEDPTLFALPHPRVFSGQAWMAAPPLRHHSQDWTEPIRWLSLPVAELGATFAEFVCTNLVGPRLLADKPAPRLSEVAVSPVPMPAKSTFRIEGDLAGRELLTPLEVPAIQHTDVLTNTVIQVCVAQPGFTFSPVVIRSSGSKEADQKAYDLVKTARFKPVARTDSTASRNPSALTWGKIIFQWHTLEMPATNGAVARPSP